MRCCILFDDLRDSIRKCWINQQRSNLSILENTFCDGNHLWWSNKKKVLNLLFNINRLFRCRVGYIVACMRWHDITVHEDEILFWPLAIGHLEWILVGIVVFIFIRNVANNMVSIIDVKIMNQEFNFGFYLTRNDYISRYWWKECMASNNIVGNGLTFVIVTKDMQIYEFRS